MDWCVSNGLVMSTDTPGVCKHAPVTLKPTMIQTGAFNHAVAVTPLLQSVVDLGSQDEAFIRESLESVLHADEFTRRCFQLWEATQNTAVFLIQNRLVRFKLFLCKIIQKKLTRRNHSSSKLTSVRGRQSNSVSFAPISSSTPGIRCRSWSKSIQSLLPWPVSPYSPVC